MPESAYFTPPLTTVRQEFAAVGRHSIELLVDEIEHAGRPPGSVVVPAALVTRHSTIGRRRARRPR